MNVDETRPEGQLVLVATPLGNLGDLSPRALEFFRRADVIYCEDTRHSRVLFSANGIASGGRLQALHEHNEVAQSEHVVTRVREGQLVVLISDAGTPGISDPGTRVVAAVAAAGLRVSTAPGPSAVVAALSISGLPTERFIMEGFFPRKANDRARLVASWAEEERTIVFYESPQRLVGVLSELAQTFPDRRVAVVRELTKLHEEVIRGTTREVAAVLEQRVILGEIVVVLEGGEPVIDVDDELVRRALREQFSSGVSTRDAVDFVSETLGASHRVVYQMALEVKKDATS
jgi:16S rRNA (cytidine1402-2'-O)-methyltransferase